MDDRHQMFFCLDFVKQREMIDRVPVGKREKGKKEERKEEEEKGKEKLSEMNEWNYQLSQYMVYIVIPDADTHTHTLTTTTNNNNKQQQTTNNKQQQQQTTTN